MSKNEDFDCFETNIYIGTTIFSNNLMISIFIPNIVFLDVLHFDHCILVRYQISGFRVARISSEINQLLNLGFRI